MTVSMLSTDAVEKRQELYQNRTEHCLQLCAHEILLAKDSSQEALDVTKR